MGDDGAALVAAVDELGAADLDQFVATRDRLARGLRADGRADAAAALRARRRPTLVAWCVNRVARNRPELVTALFDAADDVRGAVERGDGDALRTAMRAQRTRLGELTDAALEQAGSVSPNPRAHAEAIASTWEAASVDDALRAMVLAGELTNELRLGAGMRGAPTGAASTADAPAGRAARARLPRTGAPAATDARRVPAQPRRRDELALRRAEDTLAGARETLAHARRATADAEKALARAGRAAARARDDEARAQRRVADAEAALAERRSR